MYHAKLIHQLVTFVSEKNGIIDKAHLSSQVQQEFQLVKDGKIYYSDWFAIRFCQAKSTQFSNTVLALSKLQKYDKLPFFVCLLTPTENHLLLANATFLKKISHSSQTLTTSNIKGSFNGSDIIRNFEGIENIPENFEELFAIHENYSFQENLERLVEATNQISPTGKKFIPDDIQLRNIFQSVNCANSFINSSEYSVLNHDLNCRVQAVSTEIAIAALIDNVNMRGRIIEYLITGEGTLKEQLLDSLRTNRPIPKLYTADGLGDYKRDFQAYHTLTDIKTKVLFLSGNPKGYNLDKLLSFLAEEKSVYLLFIVAIDENKNIQTRLCSMFQQQLLKGTKVIKHWAGRNSRGVTQFDGKMLEAVVKNFDASISLYDAQVFLTDCLKEE